MKTLQRMWKDLPAVYVGNSDDPQVPADLLSEVRIELDLIREEQDGTEHYTLAEIRQLEKFCEKWSSKA